MASQFFFKIKDLFRSFPKQFWIMVLGRQQMAKHVKILLFRYPNFFDNFALSDFIFSPKMINFFLIVERGVCVF